MKSITLFFILLTTTLFSKELSLDEAIELVNKNNRQLKESKLDVEQQKLDENIRIKRGLPNISLGSSYNEFDKSIQRDSYFKNGVYITQPLFNGGEIYQDVKIGSALRELKEVDYLQREYNMTLDMIRVYIETIQSIKTLDVYKVSKKEKESELRKIKEFYNLSLVDKSEVLKMETSLYQTQTSILKMENQIKSKKLILKNILGLDLDENIKVKDIDMSKAKIEEINLEQDIKNTLNNGITAKKLNKNIEISEYTMKKNKSIYMPKVDFKYGYENIENSSFSKSNEDWQWTVGVGLNWDLFNFGSGVDKNKSSQLEIEKQNLIKADTLSALKKDVVTAYLDLNTSNKTIIMNKKALDSAKETYKIDKEKFLNRIIDSVDFLKSESELRDAQIIYINSQLDYYLNYQKYLTLIK